jgi:thiol-disulfide isomerase/thioredoxin
MSNLIELSSEEKFQQLIAGNVPVILNFWASWAEPCSQMNEVFKELANKFPTLKFIQVKTPSYKCSMLAITSNTDPYDLD